jgi:hypothetical protein
MVKDAAESGGRGQSAFQSADEAAVNFAYNISLKHNVAIQEVIVSNPEAWATETFMESFVERQIQEWGAAVSRKRSPKTPIFGSQRLILSSPDPRSGVWHLSHPISLNSRQLITNVGRGGTLELLRPEFIRPEHRKKLLQRLEEAGKAAMQALADYADKAEEKYGAETGREIGEDFSGLSYATPRYMMLDFLVQPKMDGDWRVILIEPNIGIGLWDRAALREEALDGKGHSGAEARIVLKDFIAAAAAYARSKGWLKP